MRYERKFLPPALSLDEVLAIVRRHPAGFRIAYPDRRIHNVYFDTPGRRHFFEHVTGAAERCKVRARWYTGPGANGRPPVFEFKYRHGLLGSKESCPTTIPTAQLANEPAAWFARCRADGLPALVRARLDDVEPVVGNSYLRRYFCSAEGHYRLTVDWEVEFSDAQRPAGHVSREGAPAVIVEVKYDQADAPGAADIINHLPFRLDRCSKYVLAVETFEFA